MSETFEVVGRLGTNPSSDPSNMVKDLHKVGFDLITQLDAGGAQYWIVADYSGESDDE